VRPLGTVGEYPIHCQASRIFFTLFRMTMFESLPVVLATLAIRLNFSQVIFDLVS
jgi:hypothetical protein